jgi:hypothetical protein
MRIKPMIAMLAAAASLAACSERAKERQERAGNAIADDVGSAADNLAASADRLADRLNERVDNLQDRVIDGAAAHVERRVGNELDRATDEAAAALTRAGDALRDRDARRGEERAPPDERADAREGQ